MQKGKLKTKKESLLIATPDPALRTNWIKSKIDKIQIDYLYKLCKSKDECVINIVNDCSLLAQRMQNKTWQPRESNPLGVM